MTSYNWTCISLIFNSSAMKRTELDLKTWYQLIYKTKAWFGNVENVPYAPHIRWTSTKTNNNLFYFSNTVISKAESKVSLKVLKEIQILINAFTLSKSIFDDVLLHAYNNNMNFLWYGLKKNKSIFNRCVVCFKRLNSSLSHIYN